MEYMWRQCVVLVFVCVISGALGLYRWSYDDHYNHHHGHYGRSPFSPRWGVGSLHHNRGDITSCFPPSYSYRLRTRLRYTNTCDRKNEYSLFKEECNSCMCLRGGGMARCTRDLCEPKSKKCGNYSVGDSYYDGCNTCTCTSAGPMCTERYCPDKLPKQTTTNKPPEKTTPKPITDNDEDDNLSGEDIDENFKNTDIEKERKVRSAVPFEFEFEPSEQESNYEEHEKTLVKRSIRPPYTRRICQPLETWEVVCNWCFCTRKGVPICTMMHCPQQPFPGPEYRTRDRRSAEEAINKRTIGEETVEESIPTPAEIRTRLSLLASCGTHDIGESWFDGCNNCVCTAYGPACTLRYCYNPKIRHHEEEESFDY